MCDFIKRDYIALLISGQVRSFVFKEQIVFFQNLLNYLNVYFNHVHVYITLKIPLHEPAFIKSDQGIQNFKEMLNVLQPITKTFFYDFKYKPGQVAYHNGQLKMIDMCIEDAKLYEKENHIKYDLFFRIRPDACILLHELDIVNKNKDFIYTSIKHDALGSDQVFIFNHTILEQWWDLFVRQIMMYPTTSWSPEYIIFTTQNKHLIQQCFQCWLIRDYGNTCNWCKKLKNALETEYIWMDKNEYNKLNICISDEMYIDEMKKIGYIVEEMYI
jgi:hypothetical protein